VITRNLNRIIDINYYPVIEAQKSNVRHRPIGIGVQGLADVFQVHSSPLLCYNCFPSNNLFQSLQKLRMPFDSDAAATLNREIFEAIYYGALDESKDIAKRDGPYETYKGSPVSKGILQYDMWNVTPSDRFNWKRLKEEIAQYGVRNR
jgi:ribonucleotide reductase alpha subunit